MLKKVMSAVIAAAFISIMSACSIGGHNANDSFNGTGGTKVLRMAQASAPTGAIGQSMDAWAKAVEEKTNGRYKINTFHNGQLGSERDNVEACELGNLDIAVVNQSILSNFIPEYAALDLPYVITSTEQADKVFLGSIGKEYLNKLDKVELKGLAFWESGFRNLTNSKKPINSLSDVKGLKIRVMENKIHQDLWKTLGTDPVPMAWGDAYTAMQQGALDGQENPNTVIDKNNVVEVNKNLAITEHVYSNVVLIMSPKTWNSISQADQKIFLETLEEANKNERVLSRKMDTEALNTLKEKGMKITRPNKEPFIQATQTVRDVDGKDYTQILKQIEELK